MRNALSGKIGILCGVLQDRLLDRSSLLFDMPCENLSSPTPLNFPLGSIYQEDMQATSSFPTFLSFFLAVCFTLSQAESAVDGKFSCFALFCTPPPLAPVLSSSLCSAAGVLHSGFALADLQPLFMPVLVWELLQTLCCE